MFFDRAIRYAVRLPKWQAVRKAHLILNPNCSACGKAKKLDVHHKIPVHIDFSKELDPENLITLCSSPCHILFGHLMDFKSWNENIEKDCETYHNKLVNRPYKKDKK